MLHPIRLLVLLRVHRRPLLTKIVLHELDAMANLSPFELSVRVVVSADRPCPGVSRLLAGDLPACISDVQHVSQPLLDLRGGGERWVGGLNDSLDLAERGETFDWVYQSDDDCFFEPMKCYEHLIPALRNQAATAYNVESLFFFGNSNTFTLTRHHASALLWRHRRGERFSGRRIVSVPDRLLDEATIRDSLRNFPVVRLDYGTATPAEAHRVTAAYLSAGISDAYTQSALLPPDLRVFPNQFDEHYGKWMDRASEFGLLTPLT
jgi:hypothetical protein